MQGWNNTFSFYYLASLVRLAEKRADAGAACSLVKPSLSPVKLDLP